jgi:hypothetical protein
MPEKAKPTGLALLREPFPANAISKLPKPTAEQTREVKDDFKKGIRCQICGGWHHPKVVHLDYVGHAALTDRLLECDPTWNWEPVAFDDKGLPATDNSGGMWIRLTVCGVTRLGYGDAEGKTGGNAVKERIGDALRNAAMRFGAALDLWHKGDLHGDDATVEEKTAPEPQREEVITPAQSRDKMLGALGKVQTAKAFTGLVERQEFKDALAALAEAAPPMALQVTAEIGKLRSKLVIDDSLPDFNSTANREDQQ